MGLSISSTPRALSVSSICVMPSGMLDTLSRFVKEFRLSINSAPDLEPPAFLFSLFAAAATWPDLVREFFFSTPVADSSVGLASSAGGAGAGAGAGAEAGIACSEIPLAVDASGSDLVGVSLGGGDVCCGGVFGPLSGTSRLWRTRLCVSVVAVGLVTTGNLPPVAPTDRSLL